MSLGKARTVKELALLNFYLAEKFSNQADIKKLGVLKTLEKQLMAGNYNNIKISATILFWLINNKPFASNNLRTALLATALWLDNDMIDFVSLADRLKQTQNIKDIESVLTDYVQ